MSKTKPRILLSLLAVILCISIFPVTAFASGGDYHDYELPPPESTEAEKMCVRFWISTWKWQSQNSL